MATNLITDLRWRTIRDEIKKELEAVVSGVVHGFVRFDQGDDTERYRKKHIPKGSQSGKIDAWTIRRIDESREYLTNKEIEVSIVVGLDFWFELVDEKATQDTFDDIVDDVKTAFQAPIRLDCNAELQGPIQLTEEDHRRFAGRLVHHAELQTLVRHRVFQQSFR